MPGEASINSSTDGHPPALAYGGALPSATAHAGLLPGPYHGETYYDIPPLRHSHYRWRTSAAFFSSGIAGGSQILAALTDLFGREEDRSLVRAGRYLALAGASAGTVLLVSALHTRSRWYNMLRIFKRTSPMSIGIWAITPFGILSGLAAAGQLGEDKGLGRAGRYMARAFGLPAALLGTVVITYMGTEQEETNMPLWASAYPLMAPLYAAAGMSNATAALLIAAEKSSVPGEMKKSLNSLALVAGAVELALGSALQRRWRRLPENGFFENSPYAPLFRLGVMDAGMMAPLALRGLNAFANGQNGGTKRSLLASALKLGGGMLMQIVMVYAGRESGRHARDYFAFTRPEKMRPGNGAGVLLSAGKPAPAASSRKLWRREAPANGGKSPLPYILGLGALAAGAAMFMSVHGRK